MSAGCIIVETGTANLASVAAGLRRAGCNPAVSNDASEILSAERVVVPGVGTFGAAMNKLGQGETPAALRERLSGDRPTLAICVGLQILFAQSEESPAASGLATFPGTVIRFSEAERVPQMGWNWIEAEPDSRFLRSGYAYFANSYCVKTGPAGVRSARADYGGEFIAGFERRGLLACQFHPELSGGYGAALLKRWVDQVKT